MRVDPSGMDTAPLQPLIDGMHLGFLFPAVVALTQIFSNLLNSDTLVFATNLGSMLSSLSSVGEVIGGLYEMLDFMNEKKGFDWGDIAKEGWAKGLAGGAVAGLTGLVVAVVAGGPIVWSAIAALAGAGFISAGGAGAITELLKQLWSSS
jgi:hypothetical protein